MVHLHIQLRYYWSVHTHISISCMCKLYTPNAWFCLVIMTTLFLPSWSPQSQSCPLVTSALGKIPFASIVLAPSRGDTRDLKNGRHTQLQLRKLHTTLLASFPGLPWLRFLIACSMQKLSQKAWWILLRDPCHRRHVSSHFICMAVLRRRLILRSVLATKTGQAPTDNNM